MELKDIKGVGTILERKLNSLNIYTVKDLIEYYPYRYNYINIIDIKDTKEDESCMVKATIIDSGRVMYIKRNFNRLNFKVVSSDDIINVTIYNRAFYKNNLNIGKCILYTAISLSIKLYLLTISLGKLSVLLLYLIASLIILVILLLFIPSTK